MWIEVLPNDDELLQKFCDVQNNISCGVSIRTLTIYNLKQAIETKSDCHAYYYDGKDFKCIIQYKWNNYNQQVQILKYSILWDYTNETINPFDATRIIFKHIYNYIQTRGKKVYFHTEPELFPEAQMLWYKTTELKAICYEEGLKATINKDDRFTWWFFEVIE